MDDAAAIAASRVAAVADDPAARLALIAATYDGPTGRAPRHAPFRRAGVSFMRWEAQRGVLNPLDAPAPGSPWWRALNDRLLRDGCEAVARAGGRGGPVSSPTVALWDAFVARPTPATWYHAHNASIASAYLEHRDLADREVRAERFFLNVVLSRVLYAHALAAAPRLALGRLRPVGRLLGDPRLGMVGVFLSMRRVLPRRYPIAATLELYLEVEQELGRILDFGVIQPRLAELYAWSAQTLELPGLADLVVDGVPAYAWSATDRREWHPPRLSLAGRLVRRTTSPRKSR